MKRPLVSHPGELKGTMNGSAVVRTTDGLLGWPSSKIRTPLLFVCTSEFISLQISFLPSDGWIPRPASPATWKHFTYRGWSSTSGPRRLQSSRRDGPGVRILSASYKMPERLNFCALWSTRAVVGSNHLTRVRAKAIAPLPRVAYHSKAQERVSEPYV